MTLRFSNLTTARMSLGITTDQLAARLGVSQSTVVRAEQSERKKAISLETLERTATALGLNFEYKFTIKSSSRSDLDEFERNKLLSAAEKLNKALELSELTQELKNAQKSSRKRGRKT